MQENKVGYTNPWVHQEAKQHHRVHKTKPRVHREAKQHHRVHKKEDHRHQGAQIGHQTDDSPCAHKGHLTGLPCLKRSPVICLKEKGLWRNAEEFKLHGSPVHSPNKFWIYQILCKL